MLGFNGPTPATATLVLGLCCFLAMTCFLRAVWQGGPRRTVFASLAGLSGAGGIALFVTHHGVELGIPIAFAVVSPAALAVVFWGRSRHQRGVEKFIWTASPGQSQSHLDTIRTVASVFLPILPALSASTIIAVLLPADEATRVVAAAYTLPVVWGAFMAWGASASRMRPLFVTGMGLTLCGVLAAVPIIGSGA